MRRALACVPGVVLAGAALGGAVAAQWAPEQGQWLKEVSTDLRVMSFNIHDELCTSAFKNEPANGWSALVHLVAALQPDVLLLQEAGDNIGNGTGMGVDSVADLGTVMQLFVQGGADPFKPGAPPVGNYVQRLAPGVQLPHVFVSSRTDGFNRNVVLSRYPFADLNGDGVATASDLPTVLPDAYAPGGQGGLRGCQLAEIDLPDGVYAGDLVVTNSHLRSGSSSAAHAERVAAAKNIAYVIEHLHNGAGFGLPDPFGTLVDEPPVQSVLGPHTPVIAGGDWNEDETRNGAVKGPAEWIAHAEFADSGGEVSGTDGTDRDGTDMRLDAAQDVFTGSSSTFGTSKLDYVAWQDSVAGLRRAFVFDSATLPGGAGGAAQPPEFAEFPGAPALLSALASDHRPVIADFVLPLAEPAPPCQDAMVVGAGTPGSGGLVPRFTVCGVPGSAKAARFVLADAPPGAAAWLLWSFEARARPLFGGVLVPAAPMLLPALRTSAAGTVEVRAHGGGGPAVLYAQWVVSDAGSPGGKSLSDALKIRIGP